MREISSKRTILYKKGLPIVILLCAIILVLFMIFDTRKTEEYIPFFATLTMFTLGWTIYFRKLEVVYIDKNDLIVRNKKILIKDVISVKQESLSSQYRVKYYDGNNINSFKFSIDTFLFIKPDFIKKLQTLVAKNNHTSPNLL